MLHVGRRLRLLLLLSMLALAVCPAMPAHAQDTGGEAAVQYRTHVQDVGWQDWSRDGAMAGTTGQSLRLEGIEVALPDQPLGGGVEYRTHVQDVGWQDWVSDGVMAGTTGQSLRLEAIQVRLTGEMADRYDVWYRVHAQDFGWLDWACNGQKAGTATFALRLEAIEVVLLPRGGDAPGQTGRPYVTRAVQYRTHVQDDGWQAMSYDGAMAGTSGRSLRLEGIQISLPDRDLDGGVEYRTHVQDVGWQDWVSDGAMAGTTGQSLRLEAIQIGLYGQMAESYDVWYRVHAQDHGWMGWTSNYGQAGTEGESRRLEAIQIVLVPRDEGAPALDYGGVLGSDGPAFSPVPSLDAPAMAPTSPGASAGGALRVSGSHLVDQAGNPVQLRGVSTHGLAWYPGYVNDACFRQLRNEWNANVVRLAMYTAEYGGYCEGGDRSALMSLVRRGVDLATSNDLYVIVDWHILSDSNPLMHVDDARAFFDEVSSAYRDSGNVLYEICNEPNGETSWDDVRAYAEQIIPVIRANDPDAIVIVGTPTWSQDVDVAASDRLPFGNVMYSLHFYAATHRDDLRDRMVHVVHDGLPVFVSEFGICDASGNGAIDQGSANSWVTTMNDLGVSWCMWSLCNKAESASAIRSSCSATSGFAAGDLTVSGTWLLAALDGSLPEGTNRSQVEDAAGVPAPPASSTAFSSNGFACTVSPVSSWPVDGGTCHQYDLSITNEGPARASWEVDVPFDADVTLVNGWNGTFVANGSHLVVGNADHNGSVGAGATLWDIGFQVTSPGALGVAP